MEEAERPINYYEPYGLGLWVFFWVAVFFSLATIGPIVTFLSIVIFFLCKVYFEEWCEKTGANPKIPFLLVLFLGLLGQLIYYIYYIIRYKEVEKNG